MRRERATTMMGSKQRHFAPLINVSLEELVPQDHFYRHLERTLDLSFVREFVLRTGQDMQIVDDSAAAQIEEVLMHTSIASTASLPLTYMSQSVLDGYPFAQLSTPLRSLLALS